MTLLIDTGWRYDDGGREAAGFKGDTRDCVTRAISIATGMDYKEVYDLINELAKKERPTIRKKRSSARTGVHITLWKPLLKSLGWTWHPTMQIGSGTTVHLRSDELPRGTLIVQCSKHVTVMHNGVILDTYDPSRDGTRAVYGYFTKED